MNVILSIRPKYVEPILSGAKRYEFRKFIFNKYVNEAYIYATSPVKKIVAVFKIGNIIRDSPKELWSRLGPLSGLNEDEFFDYFKGIEVGFAIEIENIEVFSPPLDPKEIMPGFYPPQSFCYLKYSLSPGCIAMKEHVELGSFFGESTRLNHKPLEESPSAKPPARKLPGHLTSNGIESDL
jgi:predicted transcriptional regulator